MYTLKNYREVLNLCLANNVEEQGKVLAQVDELIKDRKVDGKDLEASKKLLELRENISDETREALKKELENMLEDGYTINDDNDYTVLLNLFNIYYPETILPDYNDIIDTLHKWRIEFGGIEKADAEKEGGKELKFSLSLNTDLNSLILYRNNDLGSNKNSFGKIPLSAGTQSIEQYYNKETDYSRSNNNNIESWNLEYLKKSEYDRLYKIYGELASSMLGNNNDEGRPEIKSYLDFEVKYEGGAMINRMESIRLLEEEISKIKARDEKIRTETAQTEDGTAMRDVAPPSEPELESSYEVQKNDNLWKILKEKYNLSNAEIQKAIPLLIEFQPDGEEGSKEEKFKKRLIDKKGNLIIHPGDTLQLPTKEYLKGELNEQVDKEKYSKAESYYKKQGATLENMKPLLLRLGYNDSEIAGWEEPFNDEVYQVLVGFQKENNLVPDGIAGTKTLRLLGLINANQTEKDFYKK